jgi:hypothetical protein
MQYALIRVLPGVHVGGVCVGIDWATADHVACVAGMAGRVKDRFSAAHDKAGLDAMIRRLRWAGVGIGDLGPSFSQGYIGGDPANPSIIS